MAHTLGPIDYVVMLAYIAGVTLLGVYFYRGQKSTEEFFLAGRRMSWFPVALSITATNFSAISFMGIPGFVYQKNLQVYMAGCIAFPLTLPLAIFLFVRFFHRLDLYTAYEYLERRFHVGIRTVGSVLFIFLRLSWLATVIYVPSLALSAVTNIPLIPCIIGIGMLSTFYTTMGGMRAVIWTDVAQFFVMIVSMAAIVLVLLVSFQWDVGRIWSVAADAGRTRMYDFSLDLNTELGFWSILFGYVFINMASYGVDQIIIQRYLTTKSPQQAEASMYCQAAIVIPLGLVLNFIGIGLFAFYRIHADLLPADFSPDRVLPIFVVQQLPAGLSGLVIAGLFAATMSSVDSGVNSLTAAATMDFYERFVSKGKTSERERMLTARVGTVFWGLVATAAAVHINRLGGIVEISAKTNGFFGGVLLGIFLLGILVKRVNAAGAAVGGLLGMAGVTLIGIRTGISYWWYSPIGCCLTMAMGYLFSLFFARPAEEKLRGLSRWSLDPRRNSEPTRPKAGSNGVA